MGMVARMPTNMDTAPMPIDAKFLTLTQWLSPSFPVGAFAYSHGLEQAIRSHWIENGEDLREWLDTLIRHGSGRSDAIWIRLAWACKDMSDVQELNAQCRAFAPALERQREAERQGAAFSNVASHVWGLKLPMLQLPINLGFAARQEGLDIEAVIALYLQSFLSNLTAAAQRLMPMGQTEGQSILAQLNAACIEVAADSRDMGIEDISSTAFLSDIAAMQHETLQPRIFQS